MTNEADVVRHITDLLSWNTPHLSQITKLSGGPSSDSYCFCYRSDRYVIRVDKPLAQSLGLNRHSEKRLYEVASKLGLTPPLVVAAPEQGLLVRPYVEGRVWQTRDLSVTKNLIRLADTLRRLHSVWSDLNVTQSLDHQIQKFDMLGAIDLYAKTLASDKAVKLSHTVKILVESIEPRTTALCHNDLVVQNIVDDGSIKLIDWEFAALGDPAFDLAIVIQHHQLSLQQRQVFLNAYFPTLNDEQDRRVACFQLIYAHLLVLWLLVVQRHTIGAEADNELIEAENALLRMQQSGEIN